MVNTRIRKVSEAHPELFHYTDESGLKGILKSQCLWATHWRYVNDAKELESFREEFPRLVDPMLGHPRVKRSLKKYGINARSLHSDGSNALREALHRKMDDMHAVLLNSDLTRQCFEFYIASFCTHEGCYSGIREHGLLSQWRHYGKNGGYAIVLDTSQFEYLMKLEVDQWPCLLALGDVAYSSDPPSVVSGRLDDLPDLICAVLDLILSPSEEVAAVTLGPFIQCCTRFKHWAFAEEKEVRLVAVLNSPHMTKEHADAGEPLVERERIPFARSDGSVVPTVHLFDGLATAGQSRLPIRRIIVGPGPDQADREAKLRSFLQDIDVLIPVVSSEIPLRY